MPSAEPGAAERGRLGRRGHRDRGRAASAAPRAVSEPALSVAFFDPARQVHGLARAGATLLFEGTRSLVLDEPARLEPSGEGWAAGGRQPLRGAPGAGLRAGGAGRQPRPRVHGHRQRGRHAGRRPGHGQRDPAPARLGGPGRAARHLGPRATPATRCWRSRAARAASPGHGEELVSAALVAEGEMKAGGGSPAVDRLRRRGPPAQRRPGAVAARARTSRAAPRAPWPPGPRWSWRASTCTPRCSAGAWRARRPSGSTSWPCGRRRPDAA